MISSASILTGEQESISRLYILKTEDIDIFQYLLYI